MQAHAYTLAPRHEEGKPPCGPHGEGGHRCRPEPGNPLSLPESLGPGVWGQASLTDPGHCFTFHLVKPTHYTGTGIQRRRMRQRMMTEG